METPYLRALPGRSVSHQHLFFWTDHLFAKRGRQWLPGGVSVHVNGTSPWCPLVPASRAQRAVTPLILSDRTHVIALWSGHTESLEQKRNETSAHHPVSRLSEKKHPGPVSVSSIGTPWQIMSFQKINNPKHSEAWINSFLCLPAPRALMSFRIDPLPGPLSAGSSLCASPFKELFRP